MVMFLIKKISGFFILGISIFHCAYGQTITTIAGSGVQAYSGDGGSATLADLSHPQGVAVDSAGNIYIADQNNQRIRKVDVATGIISTIAGNGTQGYSGDGGLATLAELNDPVAITLDTSGNVYISDNGDSRIRRIDAITGIITTYAGTGTASVTCLFSGDGGPATLADICEPTGLVLDGSGNLYISDWGNNRIRKVDSTTGKITTVVGNGVPGFSGDGGPATLASVLAPSGVVVDGLGNIFILDGNNNRIRKVDVSTGIINTIAGDGTSGFSGDGGPATLSIVSYPVGGIALDCHGNLYFSDTDNLRIREIDFSTGIISTVAGDGANGFSGDGGPATLASFSYPYGINFDVYGNLYICDFQNNRVRKVTSLVTNCPTPTPTPSPTPTSVVCHPSLGISMNLYSLSDSPGPLDIQANLCAGSYQMSVYNTVGEEVRVLGKGTSSGSSQKSIPWDGKNEAGQLVASGVYIIRMIQSSSVFTAKVVVVR